MSPFSPVLLFRYCRTQKVPGPGAELPGKYQPTRKSELDGDWCWWLMVCSIIMLIVIMMIVCGCYSLQTSANRRLSEETEKCVCKFYFI